jgi:chaperone required for assembly of F1-ATPase
VKAEHGWLAAHVDEDYQIAEWGEDEEALARRAGRRMEYDALVGMLTLLD